MPLSVARELDCEWVVGRCKSYLERGDKYGAKAWILTARSLFPGDFAVQVPSRMVHVYWNNVNNLNTGRSLFTILHWKQ